MSKVYSAFQASHDTILSNYDKHRSLVEELQQILIQDITPDVLDEVGGASVRIDKAGLREFADDAGYVFRLLKRHKFTTSSTIQALRSSLAWRLTYLSTYLPSINTPQTSDIIRLLPYSCHDSFGHPIVVFELAAFLSLLSNSLDDTKTFILHIAEKLRSYLKQLNESSGHGSPILQYAVIVNAKGVSWMNSGPDLLTWYLHDVQPHFPGMLAAVFIQGHSWIHSRMWNIVKRVLSPGAQSKVVFFSQEELVGYLGADTLPQDYGGRLPHLHTLPDPLTGRPHAPPVRARHHRSQSLSVPTTIATVDRTAVHHPLSISLTAATHSPMNPFFGYPISPTSMRPRYGRRRKRDLLMTLTLLWWTKWKTIIWWTIGGIILAILKRQTSYSLRMKAQEWLTLSIGRLLT